MGGEVGRLECWFPHSVQPVFHANQLCPQVLVGSGKEICPRAEGPKYPIFTALGLVGLGIRQ